MAADPRILVRLAPPVRVPAPVEAVLTWTTCVGCWAQGRQYVRDDAGTWWARDCPMCMGVGQTMAVPE